MPWKGWNGRHSADTLSWWHGFDDYLDTKMGVNGMLSEQPRLYAPFQKLIETMKYKPETPEQAAARTEAQAERTRKNAAGWLDSAVLGSLKRHGNEEQMETYAVLKEAFLSGEVGSVEQVSAFEKSVTGRVIPKSERERLEMSLPIRSGRKIMTGAFHGTIRHGRRRSRSVRIRTVSDMTGMFTLL